MSLTNSCPRVTANHNQTLAPGLPGLATNHNQTMIRVRPLPIRIPNHNQTVVIAPTVRPQHNQTLVRR